MFGNDFLHLAWIQSWQLALIGLLVFSASRMWRNRRPQVMHLLWLLVLIKCLTPPVFSSPSGVFCWLQRTSPEQRVLLEQAPPPFVEARLIPDLQPNPNVDLAQTALAPIAETPVLPPIRSTYWWPLGLVAGWLLGAVVTFATNAMHCLRLWRKLHKSGLIEDAQLTELAEALSARIGLRRKVIVRITTLPLGPAVVGLFRPLVLLPHTLVDGRTKDELAPMLAHELIHVKRGDLWVAWLQTFCISLWWFHPIVRFASRAVSRDAELCCDEAVVAHLRISPSKYARCLLDVLESRQQLKPVPAFPGMRAIDVTSKRLERIMRFGHGCRSQTPIWCWLIALAAAAVTLPGAGLVASGQQPIDLGADVADERTRPPAVENGDPSLTPTPQRRKQPPLLIVYSLSKLIDRLADDLSCTREQSKLTISSHVDGIASSSNVQCKAIWNEDALIVRGERALHKTLQNTFAEMEQHGLVSIEVRAQIVSAPAATLEKIIQDEPADADTAKANQPTSDDLNRLAKARIVAKNSAAVATVLAELKNCKQAKFLSSPRILTIQGRQAIVSSLTKHPFVTEVDQGQPQIKTVEKGFELQVTPTAQGGDITIQLRLEVKEFDLTPTQAGNAKAKIGLGGAEAEVELQNPRQLQRQVVLTAKCENGQSLLLVTEGADGRAVLAIISARQIDPDNLDELKAAPPAAAKQSNNTGGQPTKPLAPRSDDGVKILKQMERPLSLSFSNISIEDGVRTIAQAVGVNIVFAANSTNAKFSGEFQNIPAIRILDSLLKSNELAWYLRKNVVVVAPIEDVPMTVRTYSVASFVARPPHGLGKNGNKKPARDVNKNLAALAKMVRDSVAPQSWNTNGGQGVIAPFNLNMSLVIRQTDRVHRQISELFAKLDKIQDWECQVTVNSLSFAGPIPALVLNAKPGEMVSLSKSQLESLRKDARRRRIVRMTLMDGQGATTNIDRGLPMRYSASTGGFASSRTISVACTRTSIDQEANFSLALDAENAAAALANSQRDVVRTGNALLLVLPQSDDSAATRRLTAYFQSAAGRLPTPPQQADSATKESPRWGTRPTDRPLFSSGLAERPKYLLLDFRIGPSKKN